MGLGKSQEETKLSADLVVKGPAEPQPVDIVHRVTASERYELANMLKIDRIKQRVQLDALKHLKSKSAGEIALMF